MNNQYLVDAVHENSVLEYTHRQARLDYMWIHEVQPKIRPKIYPRDAT